MITEIVTHDGPHHADEILAIARIYNGVVRVIFTRDKATRVEGRVVVDVGRVYDPGAGFYDHHQGGVGSHPDGLPFSSFGLMAPDDEVESDFVRHVDALDNGKFSPPPSWWPKMGDQEKFGGTIAWAVNQANPVNLDGSPVTDEQFRERAMAMIALFSTLFTDGRIKPESELPDVVVRIQARLAEWHAETDVAKAASVERCLAVATVGKILVLDQYEVGVFEACTGFEGPLGGVLFVVFPGPGGRQWMVQQAPLEAGSFKGKKQLPAEWAGLEAAELAAITGISDAVFCHKGRFICAAKSKAGAVALAEIAVKH